MNRDRKLVRASFPMAMMDETGNSQATGSSVLRMDDPS